MRIIAGIYRGRTLRTVKDLSVRPATDRVRQTLFDVLSNRIVFDGARVLDLFAGSGSLGIEALSRGATHATFVENGREAVKYLEENLQTLGLEEMTEIWTVDAMSFLERQSGEPYHLAFADPPYAFERTAELPQVFFSKGLIAPNGYLLIEHTTDLHYETTPVYKVTMEKRFGRTVVTFFQQVTNG